MRVAAAVLAAIVAAIAAAYWAAPLCSSAAASQSVCVQQVYLHNAGGAVAIAAAIVFIIAVTWRKA